jgi:hypothetical protein
MRLHASPLLAALIVAAATTSCEGRGSAARTTPGALEPWQVVDPAFKGCEGG